MMIGEAYLWGNWQAEAILRLLAASALGAMIGLEREQHARTAAGLRTHVLVTLGAAMAMVVSLNFAEVYGGGGRGALQVDPARVAYGIMVGIGFIGAGTIMRQDGGIRGLTTAAGMWCAAGIGMAIGFGMYLVGVAGTLLVLFALRVLDKVERLIPSRVDRSVVFMVGEATPETVQRLRTLLETQQAKVKAVGFQCDFEHKRCSITFSVSIPAGLYPALAGKLLAGAPEVLAVSME